MLLSIVAAPIYIPTRSVGGFPFPLAPYSLQPFIICRLFNDGHFHWCKVVPQYSFDLHFSNN